MVLFPEYISKAEPSVNRNADLDTLELLLDVKILISGGVSITPSIRL